MTALVTYDGDDAVTVEHACSDGAHVIHRVDYARIATVYPLTLDSELRCGRCGLHGTMIDGRWVNLRGSTANTLSKPPTARSRPAA